MTPAEASPIVARSDGRYARCVGVLREVVEADLPVFYEHQRDREAATMAAFPPRERDAFMAHWAKTLANDSALTWTVVSDGAVAGNIGCWEDDGRRLVGYWIGREFWGRGLATRALAELLDVVDAPDARIRGEEQRRLDPRAREVRVRRGRRTHGRRRDRGAPPGAAGMTTDLGDEFPAIGQDGPNHVEPAGASSGNARPKRPWTSTARQYASASRSRRCMHESRPSAATVGLK